MVDLSRLEAERQARGEDSDREAQENGEHLRVGGSGSDSPVTPMGGEEEQRRRSSGGARSQSEHGPRAPVVRLVAGKLGALLTTGFGV